MEKLSIEQKAKAYDELLLKLQKAKVDDNVCDEMYYRVIDNIVPELKESEDERIRKELIAFLKEMHETGIAEKTWSLSGIERWIAWLEKQGEQKPADKVEPKFKVGYWVTCKEIDTALIVNITDDKYEVEFIDGNKGFPHIDYVDRFFSLWTIQNAKDGDVLYSPTHHLIWIYKDNEHYYACVNMNYVTENVAIDGLINIPNDACLATKEQRKQLEKAMADAGYTFDFEKKELKKIEQKSVEWSEEDENLLELSFENLTELKDRYGEEYGKVGDCISWLKSLKQRYTWKPSDEQIKVLDEVIKNPHLSSTEYNTLTEIVEQLEKLKEE